ncbi:MAG: hypothetical protein ACXW3O_10195 [Brevundimonas sp.]
MKSLKGVMAVMSAIVITAAVSWAAPAAAQATRTWVSGVGDDANPCSRTAPCKTFAGAISKTAAGGEINCIDSGAFGTVTITKAMTIDCATHEAGVLATAGASGIIVNAGAADLVMLRGLDINGAGTGANGVRFIAGGALHIHDTQIYGFKSAAAGQGNGILFAPTGASELYVVDSRIFNNGAVNVGSGIEILPAAGGSAKVVVRDTVILDNANIGFRLNTTGNTAPAGLFGVLQSVEVSGSGQGVVAFTPAGTTTAKLMASDSSIVNNTGIGLLAAGATATMWVGSTTVSGNLTGVTVVPGGAQINTFGNNYLIGNGTDGAFTSPVTPTR